MCDAHREAFFGQKMFMNRLKMGLQLQTWVKKSENTFDKEKALA